MFAVVLYFPDIDHVQDVALFRTEGRAKIYQDNIKVLYRETGAWTYLTRTVKQKELSSKLFAPKPKIVHHRPVG